MDRPTRVNPGRGFGSDNLEGANVRMASMRRYTTRLIVTRQGSEDFEIMGDVQEEKIYLASDANIDEGDYVEWTLPNGRSRRALITGTTVYDRSPTLAHTEARYETAASIARAARPSNNTFHITATNSQVATGDGGVQQMNLGAGADELTALLEGIVELLRVSDLIADDQEVHELQEAARREIASGNSSTTAVQKFNRWVIDCAERGGSSAVVAAFTALANGLLQGAGELIQSAGAG